MANVEREDEKKARRIVESVLRVEIEHFDTDGGVDYLARDGGVAVEVTRVTDGRKRAARSGLARSADDTFDPPLASCWIVLVSSTHASTKNLAQRLRSVLADCEAVGISYFYRDEINLYLLQRPDQQALIGRMNNTGIESAWTAPHREDPEHLHEVFLSLTTDGSVGGSNESLANLMGELGTKTDNVKKLQDSGVPNRVLFVWLDGDTPYEIARPLAGEPPTDLEQQFGLPSVVPNLDPAITELWIVHEGTQRGWRWDGAHWSWL